MSKRALMIVDEEEIATQALLQLGCLRARNELLYIGQILESDLKGNGLKRLKSEFAECNGKGWPYDKGYDLSTEISSLDWIMQEQKTLYCFDSEKFPLRIWHSEHFDAEDKTDDHIHNQRSAMRITVNAWSDLVFPGGDKDAVKITNNDYLLLNTDAFVNDTIVDFYIKVLQSRLTHCERQRFHFFNTFFFRKLSRHQSETNLAFDCVKRWTENINIFEKDLLLLPILQSSHWSLIVVFHPGNLYNSEQRYVSTMEKCTILHFDSLQGCHKGLKKLVKNYLVEHWIRMYPLKSSSDTRVPSIAFRSAEVPQQSNSFDCGLFMLHYMEMLVKGYHQPGVMRVSRNWFDPADASNKRVELKKLIDKLQEEEMAKSVKCIPIDVDGDQGHQGS